MNSRNGAGLPGEFILKIDACNKNNCVCVCVYECTSVYDCMATRVHSLYA